MSRWYIKLYHVCTLASLFFIFTPHIVSQDVSNENEQYDAEEEIITSRIINAIYIHGNRNVTTEAILSAIPYRPGELFSAEKTTDLIKNVYNLGNFAHGMGHFKNVKLMGEEIGKDKINLHIFVEEKYLLERIILEGNRHLPRSEIEKKINFSDIPAIDEQDLKKLISIIKGLYRNKSYHNVHIDSRLEIHGDKATSVLCIKENKPSLVKRVFFKGNCYFNDKTLRGIIFTREDWILGFLDRAGTYQPDAIEADKQTLENFYQSHGFFNAKVIGVDVEHEGNDLFVTFHVQEGDMYCISEVRAPGNDILSEEQLLPRIPVKVGQPYSKDRIRQTLEKLRLLWGEFGYIYADIEPAIQPDDDNKTVSVTFYSELGPEVRLNRINIIGNCKTRDKVIRRQLTLECGDLLTTQKMDESKANVELLGYFDPRDGVNWKINRVDQNTVDLDLIVNEIKTGKVFGQIGFGGSQTDITNPTESLTVAGTIEDTNLFGLGVHFNLNGEVSRRHHQFVFNVTEPWLFDRPIYASFNAFKQGNTYEDFTLLTQSNINEKNAGGSITLGYVSELLYDATISSEFGINSITYDKRPTVGLSVPANEREELQGILDKRFMEGAFPWLMTNVFKDQRNHPMHPTRGYKGEFVTRTGFPTSHNDIGFFKVDLDWSYYTPLIGEYDLIYAFHVHMGIVTTLQNKTIPFRELYHIGGPASVRGFRFGEIGPTWRGTESLGGKKAFWVNSEIIFPFSGDFAMKAVVFYDGGAGWDTPDQAWISRDKLKNHSFNYRHSVGIGVRLIRPTPVKLDWGFKLDRRKGESPYEVHFTAYHNF